MYSKIQVVFDAAEPEKLPNSGGLRWATSPSPRPRGSPAGGIRADAGIPEEDFEVASRIDPAGEGPRLYFRHVPEGKTAKNRVHLDISVADRHVRGEARKQLVSEHVERLFEAGASLAWRTDDVRGSSVTLYDPEGNEFCVH